MRHSAIIQYFSDSTACFLMSFENVVAAPTATRLSCIGHENGVSTKVIAIGIWHRQNQKRKINRSDRFRSINAQFALDDSFSFSFLISLSVWWALLLQIGISFQFQVVIFLFLSFSLTHFFYSNFQLLPVRSKRCFSWTEKRSTMAVGRFSLSCCSILFIHTRTYDVHHDSFLFHNFFVVVSFNLCSVMESLILLDTNLYCGTICVWVCVLHRTKR